MTVTCDADLPKAKHEKKQHGICGCLKMGLRLVFSSIGKKAP